MNSGTEKKQDLTNSGNPILEVWDTLPVKIRSEIAGEIASETGYNKSYVRKRIRHGFSVAEISLLNKSFQRFGIQQVA